MAITDRNGMIVRIAANLEELKKAMADGTRIISTTTDGMRKLASSLEGAPLERQAHNITAAINEIGGVTKLTDAEAKRLLGTLDAWLAKSKLIGREVPSDLLQTRDALRKVVDESEKLPQKTIDWKNALTSVAGLAGIAFSATAVIAFGKHVFDTASEIHDMSERLGISTDAVQGFKFAAEQSGSTLDAVGTAINKMNDNLAGGNKATVQALSSVGLKFQDIRSMRPEDAFLAITDAIQKIPDPMTQADTAMALFGKSAAELLPGIKEGFRGVAAGADKMSDDTIRDLEAAQDAWDQLSNKVIIASGTIIAHAMRITETVTSSWRSAILFLDNAIKGGVGMAAMMADTQGQAAAAITQAADAAKAAAPIHHKTAEELAGEESAAKKAAAAHRAHAEAIQALADKYNGNAIAKKVSDLAEAMRKLPASANWSGLAADVGKLFQEGAKLTPEMLNLGIAFGTLTPKMISVSDAFRDVHDRIDIVTPKIGEMWTELNKPIPYGISHLKDEFAALVVWVPKATDVVKKHVSTLADDMGKAFQQLPQMLIAAFTGGGGVKGAAQAMGTLLGSTLGKSIGEGIKALGKFGGPIGEAIGALAGPLMEKIIGMFDRNKGRDVVTAFAGEMGGFDALHAKLGELGAEGERLWIQLTQGVGRNNPGQAQAAVDAVTAALERQKDAVDKTADAATKAGDAQAAATAKAQAAVDEMTGQIKSLQDSIAGEAPEEFMGIVEMNTRAQIDAIAKQRDAAQRAIDETTATAAEAADKAADVIDAALGAREYHIRVKVDLDGMPGSVPAIPMADGGDFIVTRPTLFLAGEAGPERATFSGSNGASRAPRGGDITVNLIMPDGEVLLRQVVLAAKRQGLA